MGFIVSQTAGMDAKGGNPRAKEVPQSATRYLKTDTPLGDQSDDGVEIDVAYSREGAFVFPTREGALAAAHQAESLEAGRGLTSQWKIEAL